MLKKAFESIKHRTMWISIFGGLKTDVNTAEAVAGVVEVVMMEGEVTVVWVMVVEVIVVVTVVLVMAVSEEMVVGKVVACGSLADSVELLRDVNAGR